MGSCYVRLFLLLHIICLDLCRSMKGNKIVTGLHFYVTFLSVDLTLHVNIHRLHTRSYTSCRGVHTKCQSAHQKLTHNGTLKAEPFRTNWGLVFCPWILEQLKGYFILFKLLCFSYSANKNVSDLCL